MKRVRSGALILLLSITVTACATLERPPPESLYERLGGKASITAAVNHLWGVVARDERISGYYIDTDPQHLTSQLIDFLCAGSGGPCSYSGQDMYRAHAGMNVTSDAFDALVEDIVITLDHFKVSTQVKAEVMNMVGGLKQSVVYH